MVPARTRTSGWSRSPATPTTATSSAPRRSATSAFNQPSSITAHSRRLEDAVRHHLDVFASMRGYNPHAAGVAADLCARAGSYRASARESRSRSGYADPLDRRGVPAPGRFRPTWTAGSARAAGEPGQAGSTIGPEWSSGPSLPMNSSDSSRNPLGDKRLT